MLRRLILCFPLVFLAAPAMARDNYALLIGASQYWNLDEGSWLKGPGNDVKLVRTYLTTAAPVPFDAANVMVLADGVDGARMPTLAGIRAAFSELTAKSRKDQASDELGARIVTAIVAP